MFFIRRLRRLTQISKRREWWWPVIASRVLFRLNNLGESGRGDVEARAIAVEERAFGGRIEAELRHGVAVGAVFVLGIAGEEIAHALLRFERQFVPEVEVQAA